jgi:hypothetical protein
MHLDSIEYQKFDELKFHPSDTTSSFLGETESIDLVHAVGKPMLTSTLQSLKKVDMSADVYYMHYVHRDSFSVTIHKVTPTKPWKAAKPRTVDRYSGLLAETIHALAAVSDDKLDHLFGKFRTRQ